MTTIGTPQLQIQRLTQDAVLPCKAHPEDSGYDIVVIGIEKVISDRVTLYKTGIKIAPSPGYYTELIARSSLMKTGHMLANGVGVIDNNS